jgi:hypothetical protein
VVGEPKCPGMQELDCQIAGYCDAGKGVVRARTVSSMLGPNTRDHGCPVAARHTRHAIALQDNPKSKSLGITRTCAGGCWGPSSDVD